MTSYFGDIRAESLTINKSLTSLVWGRRGPAVLFLAANSVAKLFGAAAPAAVAAATGYIIGTNTAAWEYRINTGPIIRVGMATAARSMAAIDAGPDVIFHEFKVLDGDTISFALSAAAVLTITPPAPGAAVVVSMAGFAGQTLYPWAAGGEYSITISRRRGVTIGVTAAGGVEISTAAAVDAAPLSIVTGGAGLTIDGVVAGAAAVTTVGPIVADLFGSITLPTPSYSTTLMFSRVGNTVTMSWSGFVFTGTGVASGFNSPVNTIPIALRPALGGVEAFATVVTFPTRSLGVIHTSTNGRIAFTSLDGPNGDFTTGVLTIFGGGHTTWFV